MKKPDYKNSIVNVSKSILKHYGVYGNNDTIKILDEHLKQPTQHVIYMLLDGLGVNILKKHLDDDAFFHTNLKREITSVFPPTTVAATNAVLAGKAPISTGYLGWVQYFKDEDINSVVFHNEDFYTEKKAPIDLQKTYLSYQNLGQQINAVHADVETHILFPDFVEGGSKTLDEHLSKLQTIVKSKHKTFTYAYWTEPDLSQHELGIDHPKIKILLSEMDQKIKAFSETLNKDTLLVIIADHGLIDVESIDLSKDEKLLSLLERQPSLEPRATNFFIKDGSKEIFKKHFLSLYKDYFQLYTKEQLLEVHLLGYGKKHSKINTFLGDFIAVAKSNYMFSLKAGVPFKAHHAGLTDAELRVPLIIFRKNC